MKEEQVQAVFAGWLLERGWDVIQGDRSHVDLITTRGAERLLVEVKGHTSEPGLDVDTLYGQILRRMDDHETTRYAIVVPERITWAAERVNSVIRQRLDLDLYAVDDFSEVRPIPQLFPCRYGAPGTRPADGVPVLWVLRAVDASA